MTGKVLPRSQIQPQNIWDSPLLWALDFLVFFLLNFLVGQSLGIICCFIRQFVGNGEELSRLPSLITKATQSITFTKLIFFFIIFSPFSILQQMVVNCGELSCHRSPKQPLRSITFSQLIASNWLYPYVIFVILLTPAPFSADTKNTDFSTPKNTNFWRFSHQNILIHGWRLVSFWVQISIF